MTSRARWMVLAAALLMATAYVLPLWRVNLIAPQYPEGLGMLIRVDGVEGVRENDLNSINNLNHYIGMQAIEPDAIPELKWMPWILGALIVGGLAVLYFGRRLPLYVFGGALLLVFSAGLFDYWRWGYHYGHDIDREHAIIKIPGMTYQPPLIGSKQLLNFRATSWPASGGIALALAALLVVGAAVDSRRKAMLLLAAVAIGCGGSGPRELVAHEEQCEYCRMEIADPRFGAQVITRTGKVHLFDSVECLAGYVHAAAPDALRDVWVIDAEAAGNWVRAAEAGYLLDGSLRAPMGRVVAFASPAAALAAQSRHGGVVVSWNAVLTDSATATQPEKVFAANADELVVGEGERYATLAAALAAAIPGVTIRVRAGTYREPTVTVSTPGVTITGEGWPTFDGEGARQILLVHADSVTVQGLTFTNTGVSHMEDRAALRVIESSACVIAGNRFRDVLYAVYLQRSAGCVVRDNDIASAGAGESTNGNGIHLWHSPGTHVLRNTIRGQRDGIYFEFSRGAVATGNVSEANSRYGLHFMFSDSCRYEENVFRGNKAGVAVMYSREITMTGNAFLEARGSGAYGLLLKDITDGTLANNEFSGNSAGLYLEGASRLAIRDNLFSDNGWAIRLMADAQNNHFSANRFVANAFDVTTNSRTLRSTFEGNFWDAYRGYDLDRDGTGDVPFHPVRLFSLVVGKHPEALVLLRSPVTLVLDAAERVFPVLTPNLADAKPLMRAPL